ncbi:heat-inducible transcription repressor HrcA [Geobacter pelophilus]|uniref:Heat-inducible transcription repressor HrcA n=1 Tax=Geoanaerobacter pelophilus TaxID=60036 RepID=A0AAW4L9M4_9BACT|nr:heat-inducible transcriptional repressor HrcA [Geoanaerobacter pelophilus]MBT0665031.1 heat-inducible transcription repressor HrcA [Geoanaerobacter pelophilus]
MQSDLNDRSKQILEAIIEDYILTAEPVGSRTITRRHPLDLSPATVRNVMSDLEEMGYLTSPHTSAGRVPTDKAYRLYVDSLLAVRRVSRNEREEIRRRCSIDGRDIGSVLRDTSRILSSVSHYMGVVVAPRFTAAVLQQIEFVKLSGNRILVILVSQTGSVQNKIIESDELVNPADLERMNNYLNGMLQGLTISQVKSRLILEMQDEKTRYDRLMSQAIALSQKTMGDSDSEIFLEGQTNIMELPEFADIGKMKEMFRTFEEKNHLVGLLDRCMDAEGFNIFIGAESRLSQMAGISVITSTYRTGRNSLGVLGVIGPTRMGYAKVIPVVDYTAKLVSRLLDGDR